MQSANSYGGNTSFERHRNAQSPSWSNPNLGNLMAGCNDLELMQMISQYSPMGAGSNPLALASMIPDLTSPGSLTSGLNRYEMSPWQNMTPYQNSMGSRIQSPNQRVRRPSSNNHT